MRATVKGIKVTVNVSLSLGEIREISSEERKGETPRTRNSENFASDVNVNAGLGLEVESYEGEIDISELSEIVKTCLTDSIRQQVKDEMQNASTPEEITDKEEEVIHNVDSDTPPTKEEMKEIDNLLRKENTEKEDDDELY